MTQYVTIIQSCALRPAAWALRVSLDVSQLVLLSCLLCWPHQLWEIGRFRCFCCLLWPCCHCAGGTPPVSSGPLALWGWPCWGLGSLGHCPSWATTIGQPSCHCPSKATTSETCAPPPALNGGKGDNRTSSDNMTLNAALGRNLLSAGQEYHCWNGLCSVFVHVATVKCGLRQARCCHFTASSDGSRRCRGSSSSARRSRPCAGSAGKVDSSVSHKFK